MTEKKPSVDELVQFAMEIAQVSGEKALNHYGKGKKQVKFDRGLVTKSELELTNYFERQLRQHFPEHERFENVHDKETYTHDEGRYLWIFDPLDGVANFQAGIPIWGISIAVLENFWPVLGVIFLPATGDLFRAVAGDVAYRGYEPIKVSTQETINDESLLLTYSRVHQHYKTSFPGKVRNFGCNSAHACYVAMGRAEAALTSHVSFQGLAAARVLLEAAGARITKANGDEFFLNEFLNGNRIEDRLLMGRPDIIDQVRETISEII